VIVPAQRRRLLLIRNQLAGLICVLGGGTGLAVAALTPDAGAREPLNVALFALCTVAGAALLRYGRRVSDRGILIVAVAGQILLTTLAYGSMPFEVATGMLGYAFIWSCAFVAYYFPWRQSLLHVLGTLTLYGWWLAMSTPAPIGRARWVAVAGLLTVFACVFGMLRDRVNNLIAELERDVRSDGLTGVLNRRGFFEVATAATLDAARQGRTVAVIAADLDHFKVLNDLYGHAAGDEALRNFGAVLKDVRRTGDEAGRLGGEEFCLLLPDTEIEGARAIAQRLLQQTHLMAAARPVTVSLGLAVLRPGDADDPGRAFEELLSRADRVLYEAKASGRDRLCVDDSSDPRPAPPSSASPVPAIG
jgi:diguanylate cyclase (GGDEF)-like protein